MPATVRHRAIRTPPVKVIAVDADGTLWTGVLGEDGATGLVIDAPRRALHRALLEQQRAGVLLALVSKNEEDDVIAAFRARSSELVLGLEHFTALKIGWTRKSEALAEIARELNLGLDAFMFIDDSPVECGEVRAAFRSLR